MNTSMLTPSGEIPAGLNPQSTRALRLRNALARKKLERRRDRKLLRSHLTEVWDETT